MNYMYMYCLWHIHSVKFLQYWWITWHFVDMSTIYILSQDDQFSLFKLVSLSPWLNDFISFQDLHCIFTDNFMSPWLPCNSTVCYYRMRMFNVHVYKEYTIYWYIHNIYMQNCCICYLFSIYQWFLRKLHKLICFDCLFFVLSIVRFFFWWYFDKLYIMIRKCDCSLIFYNIFI